MSISIDSALARPLGAPLAAPPVAPTTPAPAPITTLGAAIDRLLRDRRSLVAELTAGRGVATIARAMLVTIAIGAALFGAAIGTYRGGPQIAYAAIKLPIVLVFTAAIATPALTAFNLALDRPAALRRDLALALCALGLGALVLAALAPVVLVARAVDAPYHETSLLFAGACALAGLVSLAFLARALRAQTRRWAGTAAALLATITAAVGAQAAWTLRPYLVRPRATVVPFVRTVDGDLIDAVHETIESVRGDYRRDRAPLPGEDAAEELP